MKGYLTTLNFIYCQPAVFRAALLFYSDLYLPFDPASLKWTGLDRLVATQIYKTEWPGDVPIVETQQDLVVDALKIYLRYNPRVWQKIQTRLHDPRTLGIDAKEFFEVAFDIPLRQGRGTPIFSIRLFDEHFYTLARPYIERGLDLRYWIYRDVPLVHQDLFVTHFLRKRYGVAPVMTTEDVNIRLHLLNNPSLPLWDDQLPGVASYFDCKTVGDLLGTRDKSAPDVASGLGDILVPDLGLIPIEDLIDYIVTDRVKPLTEFVQQLVEKYGSSIRPEVLAEEVVGQLFRAVHVLYPSIPSLAIGILGNLPMPLLVNPVGIITTGQAIVARVKFDREYPWLLALSELRKL